MDNGQAEDWLLDLAQQHRLSPSQRQIVQRMLGMFPDVAFLSTVEISRRAGVSQPTVTRLATALGFGGFPEFREALREVVLGSPPHVPAPRHSAIDQECANVAALKRVIAGDKLAMSAGWLAESLPVGVVGLRASGALADYFAYFARRVLPAVNVCTDAGAVDDFLVQLRGQGASAVLFFAMPRYPAATVAAIRQARDLRMSTVVITDEALAPFAPDADAVLVAPVGRGLTFD